jgi:cobalamin biosynthesis Mg chelatase CobN
MNHDRMLAVLTNLANGIDPASGTAFPADSPYQHPETVRALFLALRRLEAAGSATTSQAAGSATTSQAAGSATTSQAAGSATTSHAAGSAHTSQAAGSADLSDGATSAAAAETPAAGRKPAANSAAGKGGNAGKAWTAEEDQRLAAAFDAGEDINALTRQHGRSRLALEIRLAKLGRLPMPENTLYGRKPQTQDPQSTPSAGERQGKARSATPRSAGAPRRASESGGLRYHVARPAEAIDLRA